jgi:hypothetical protein
MLGPGASPEVASPKFANSETEPQALTAPLFQPIDQSEGTTLGMDKFAFFADPRWRRLWFTCAGAY